MATSSLALTATAWTDLGSTPCFLQSLSSSPITFVVDTAAPASLSTVGHVLDPSDETSANVSTAGARVFARALSGTATVVVTR